MSAPAGVAYVPFHADMRPLLKEVAALTPILNSRLAGIGAKAGAAGLAIGGIATAAGLAGKALYDIGQNFDDAYDTIQSRTGATGKELGKLKKDFQEVVKDVPADFDTAGKAVAGLNQRLDVTGKPLRRLSKQLLELSRITDTDINENVEATTRLFGDWSIKTDKQSKTLDRMFRLTQSTGIELSELSRLMVQFGSPLRQLGFSFDEAAVMFARFEKEGVNIQTMVPGLRMALKNIAVPSDELGATFDKLGVDTKDIHAGLMDVFTLIEEGKIDAEVASQIFGGRAWADMKAAVEEGRFEFEKLIRDMRAGEDTILGTGRKTRDAAENFQIMKNRLSVLLEEPATRFFKGVGEAIKDLNRIMEGGEPKGDFVKTLRDIINVARRVESAIEDIPGLDAIFPDLGQWRDTWRKVKNPVIDAIDAILGGLSSYLDAIGKVPDNVPLFGKMGDAASDAADEINELRDQVRGLKNAQENAHGANSQAYKDFEKQRKGLSQLGSALNNSKKDVRQWASTYEGRFGSATKASKGMVKNVGRALGDLETQVNNAIKDTGGGGGQLVNFSVSSSGGDEERPASGGGGGGGGGNRAARGGLFQYGAPGDVGPDSIPSRIGGNDVMVAPGEVAAVFNRHQLPVLNARLSDLGGLPGFFKQYDRPHYMARGGIVGMASGGLQPGIARLANWAKNELGLSVSSGVRPGDSDSFHGSGEAVDLVPPSMGSTKSIFRSWKDQLEELFYDPWGGWDAGQMIGAIGGHGDHIHAAILGSGSGGAQGAFTGAAAPQLKRMILSGPAGAFLNIGQGAIDLVQKSAQAYVDKHAGGGASVANGPLKQMGRELVLQMWNAGQWPPFDELVTRESGWDPEIVNESSGAAGLAQALPPSKYPPGAWPYRGVDSARIQLEWMVQYIKERYGTPAGAIRFHDANNWYAPGGIVSGKGDNPGGGGKGSLIDKILKKTHKGKPIKKLLEKVKKLGLDKKLQEKVTAQTEKAAEFEELADRAGSLTVEDEDGNIFPGVVQNLTEGEWLQKALDKLWELRNTLTKAYEQAEDAKKQIEEMLEKARKRLEKLREERKGLVEQLKGKKGKDRSGVQKQIDAIDDERTHIRDKVIGTLKTQSGDLSTQQTDLGESLTDVQGIGSPMGTIDGDTNYQSILPQFGGRLFDVALRLRDLNAPAETLSADTDTEDIGAELQKQIGDEWMQRFFVSQSQYGTFQRFFPPFGGSFAEGGQVPGPTGAPRTIIAHGGEVIGQEGPPVGDNYFLVEPIEGTVRQISREEAHRYTGAVVSRARRRT